MIKLYGLDSSEQECEQAMNDERGGMAAIAWPLLAIAATVACWVIAGLLTVAMQ